MKCCFFVVVGSSDIVFGCNDLLVDKSVPINLR